MLFAIVSVVAVCLLIAPIIGRTIARRIDTRQKQYVRANRAALRAAAETWRLALREAESAPSEPRSSEPENSSAAPQDQAEAIAEWR